jgi:hypothetical protein
LLDVPGCSGRSDDANDNDDSDKEDIVCPHGWWILRNCLGALQVWGISVVVFYGEGGVSEKWTEDFYIADVGINQNIYDAYISVSIHIRTLILTNTTRHELIWIHINLLHLFCAIGVEYNPLIVSISCIFAPIILEHLFWPKRQGMNWFGYISTYSIYFVQLE